MGPRWFLIDGQCHKLIVVSDRRLAVRILLSFVAPTIRVRRPVLLHIVLYSESSYPPPEQLIPVQQRTNRREPLCASSSPLFDQMVFVGCCGLIDWLRKSCSRCFCATFGNPFRIVQLLWPTLKVVYFCF